MLDSDVEGGWSFSMATPACIRQGVKETPLQPTADEDNSTLLESTREESVLDRTKELSDSCEKVCNRVVLRPGEKVSPKLLQVHLGIVYCSICYMFMISACPASCPYTLPKRCNSCQGA